MLCGLVRKRHPWGDAKAIKVQSNYLYKPHDLFWLSFSCFEYLNIVLVQEEIDKRLVEILGPKTEVDCWPTGSSVQVSEPLSNLAEHPLVLSSTR